MILSNATPLIYLAKIGKLDLLRSLYKEVSIPEEVYKEVVKGKEDKFFDALIIDKSIKDGWIKIKKVKVKKEIESFASEIDLGEIELISLATETKPYLILIDDASARAIAESFGFNVKGTIYVLLRAYKKKMISKKEVKEFVNKLIIFGFRISQEFYVELLDELDKM